MEHANDWYDQALDLTTDAAFRRPIENRRHRREFARRGEARIAYYRHGVGEETVVFIFPFAAYDVAMCQPLLEQLCQEFHIVTFDSRGTGASSPAPSTYPVDEQMQDVRAVIEALECGPVIGVGISWGANYLLKLACRHPGLVKKCLLQGISLDDMRPGSPFPDPWEFARRFDEAVTEEDLEETIRMVAYSVASEPTMRDLAEAQIEQYREIDREQWLDFWKGDPGLDVSSLLGEVNVPTLVTHGTEDRSVPFECGRYVAERIPGALFYPFKGKGHQPIFTATAEFCEVLRQFIRTGTVPETSNGHD